MKPAVRTDDLGRWNITIRNCVDFEQAAGLAQQALLRTQQVLLWPMRDRWLLIIKTQAFVN
jgi:hypothetical protein